MGGATRREGVLARTSIPMTTWTIGDIHGCSDELARLLEMIAPGEDDLLLSCGDLFHRGPDPAGVMDLMREHEIRFILGNHERTVLSRMLLAPDTPDPEDRPERRDSLPPLDEEDLLGDGGMPCHLPPERRLDLARFLQTHIGYHAHCDRIADGSLTHDRRKWCMVHAGIDPRRPLLENSVEKLVYMRRLGTRGEPWWYEEYRGDELLVFGHSASRFPRAHYRGDQLVALGIDTGCVYGGSLTAYSPELDRYLSVKAAHEYAA
jgi:serine/threonine protein phosphatase 1